MEKRLRSIIIQASFIILLCCGALVCLKDRMPFVPELLRYARYLAVAALLFLRFTGKYKTTKPYKWFVVLYLVYVAVIMYSITSGLKIPLEDLQQVFEPNIMLRESLIILVLILSVPVFNELQDTSSLCKAYIILTIIPGFLYVHSIGIAQYLFISYMQMELEEAVINPLTLSYLVMIALIMAWMMRKSWTDNQAVNTVITIVVAILGFYVLLASGKRGPVLWLIVSVMTFYMLRTKSISKSSFKMVLWGGVIVGLMFLSLPFLSKISPDSAEQFERALTTFDTSGRLSTDGDDSGFGFAWEQFTTGPLFGSYFRLYDNQSYTWYGAYPHNLVLESLLTWGIVGTIPFLYLILLSFISIRKDLMRISKEDLGNHCFLYVVYIGTFFSLMSSGTILLKFGFWVPAAYALNKITNLKLK